MATVNDTPYINRKLNLSALLEKKSHFLLGPRQTGKSSLMEHELPNVRTYNLLDTNVFLSLGHDPKRIEKEITKKDQIVAIDEIQRLPQLLNEVQLLIDKKKIRFLLTGSSARKLKRGGVNLLGGRARVKTLHPFAAVELGDKFDLNRALQWGLLPSVYFSDDPKADVEAYAGMYLKEEIVAEGATRNVPAFSRFLNIVAFCNATIVNFTNLANDAQVPRTTVYEYFEILRDTLILHELPAWKQTKKRKPLSSSKYYFFDIGVVHGLQNRRVQPGSPEYGDAFETFIMHELKCYSDYVSSDPIYHWRSSSGLEVDFIINDHTAIEVKAKKKISSSDLRSLRAISEESFFKRIICVSLEEHSRVENDIEILPYQQFLSRLWAGEIR